MRKALVVGIDHYKHLSPLRGCVNDANSVESALKLHFDGSPNLHTQLMTGTGPASLVERAHLKEAIKELFKGEGDISLFYFSGHGHSDDAGGYLCTSDSKDGDDGVSLTEIMTLASLSTVRHRIIVLDSCFSGRAGDSPLRKDLAELQDGMTIIAASTANQYAIEQGGSGVFTSLFVDALMGQGAANLMGDVTPGSVYAHVDQSLGPWSQRPVFKTNVKSFVSLRKVKPPLEPQELRRIVEFFPKPEAEFQLDPAFEPERQTEPAGTPPPDPEKNAIFAILQNYNRVNLVVPEGAPHMWHAAIFNKTVRLTPLGEYYRRLVAAGLI